MESLNYYLDGRGLFSSDNIEFSVDALARGKSRLKEWDMNPLSDSFEGQAIPTDTVGFTESGLPDILKEPLPCNPCLVIPSDGRGYDSSTMAPSSKAATSVTNFNSLFGEARFVSRLSSPDVNPSNQKARPSNSMPEKLREQREGDKNHSPKPTSDLSFVESYLTAKRPRSTNLHSQTPTCQVLGCDKDLSSSKEYHKRHKVCDLHSKTAKVIVNGIEQRFCQQCSRFHLLKEFDDDKRSCRKRLAGHNERRRKPQFDNIGLRSFRQGMPFLLSQICSGGFLGQEHSNNNMHIKFETGPPHNFPQLAVPVTNGRSNSTRALSLLSARSLESPRNSRMISVALPPTTAKSFGSSECFTCDQQGTPVVPEASSTFKFQAQRNTPSAANRLAHEIGDTVDLFQLSSHLQRVEQQRNSVQVKEEDDSFSCCFTCA